MAGDTRISLTSAPAAGAPDLWRGPEEWANTAEFRDMMTREFPDDVETWTDPVTRRHFISIMGASIALAGFGCSPRPASQHKILPYTKIPDGMLPGTPQFYSSAVLLGGVATGVLVKSHEGRPVKIEGNPSHPGSLGSTDVFAQAAILGLYDPDRSQSLLFRGSSETWETAISTLRIELEKLKDKKGANIRVLTETVTSPSLHEQINKFTAKYGAKWVQYEPATRDNARAGTKLAFDADVSAVYDFTKANVVVALDADFLTSGPGAVRYARDFASRRRVRHEHEDGGTPAQMNRLYAVEPMLTSTGAVADHRLPFKASDVESFARALAAALNVEKAPSAGSIPDSVKAWIAPLVKDLLDEKNQGKSIVIAGDHQPAAVHALAFAINEKLGNFDKTVRIVKSIEARPEDQGKGFADLVLEMSAGKVDVLFILGGNPVFNSPVDLDFDKALDKVSLKVHLGLYQDETAGLCHWHIPEAHTLESWGDARGYDGTVSIIQPLIAPLYNGRSALELLSALAASPDQAEQSGHDVVRAHWEKVHGKPKGSTEFEHFWERAVRDGVVSGTASQPASVALSKKWAEAESKGAGTGTEVCFRIDPTIYDGRFANLGWLQELPKPVSKLCWDNAAIMSPKTAEKHQLSSHLGWVAGEHGRSEVQFVELNFDGRMVKAAAWIQPGHADDSVTVYLGHGRERAGRVGNNTGFNAYKIRPSLAPWTSGGLDIKKVEEKTLLACTQAHHAMEGRKPVRRVTLMEYGNKKELDKAMAPPVAAGEVDLINKNLPGSSENMPGSKTGHHHDDHDHPHEHKHDKRLTPLTVYPDMNGTGHRWAMAIDLTSCIGCNVCMIACMAENNIPVVGKHEVTRGREMYWIRVDRYHEGDPSDAVGLKTYFQPVPCQQCEKAPCEVVCPVGATVHSTDGLNDMVYNRCVGTRYCSNNCPYKVRRFNFFSYADFVTESLKLGRNPEVSVRSRGVMEKCTYCVQRIRGAEIEAEREWATREKDENGRPKIHDGAIATACQAACPTQAIAFGDLTDSKSVVRRWKSESTNYGLLAELNTMPRTSYLAAVRNPNPDMPKGA